LNYRRPLGKFRKTIFTDPLVFFQGKFREVQLH